MRRQKPDKLNKMVIEKDEIINSDLFKKYFLFHSLSDMQKKLSKTQNAQKNKDFVQEIKDRATDFDDETTKMSKNENEKANEILDTDSQIIAFNKSNQQGQGLNILTLQQMLSRLQISLAQLKAGKNSEKLKNEIRQLLYSLYR